MMASTLVAALFPFSGEILVCRSARRFDRSEKKVSWISLAISTTKLLVVSNARGTLITRVFHFGWRLKCLIPVTSFRILFVSAWMSVSSLSTRSKMPVRLVTKLRISSRNDIQLIRMIGNGYHVGLISAIIIQLSISTTEAELPEFGAKYSLVPLGIGRLSPT